jgi:RNA recognition motif-containing protein
MQERHDVFVGNLTFNVTDDRLREVFEFVGKYTRVYYELS